MDVLRELLKGMTVQGSKIDLNCEGICLDSRLVTEGDLFFANAGETTHGKNYIADAIQRGASGVVVDQSEDVATLHTIYPHTAIYAIEDLKLNMSFIAARFYKNLQTYIPTIGITGTNGKTSCCHFIGQIHQLLQKPCFIIGTLGNGLYGQLHSASLTTPDAFHLQALKQEAIKRQAQALVMEVSSHALQQHRTDSMLFDVAIFTNLSRDHLDYHIDMQSYFEAKKRLFKLPGLKTAVINIDDAYGDEIVAILPKNVQAIRYGLRSDADISAKIIEKNTRTTRIAIKSPWGQAETQIPLLGDFNISNVLAVMGGLLALNWSWNQVCQVLPGLQAVPGRMQILKAPLAPDAVIDYAHTPDALEKTLTALRAHHALQGKIICVFGCGGDRDSGKRPQMGKIADQYCDAMILTSDNPRSEDPLEIIRDILSGIENKLDIQIEVDRKKAICMALSQAGVNDIVLIAGKGHEDYQIIGKSKMPFSDLSVVQKWHEENAK